MNSQKRRLPTTAPILIAITIAIGAMIAATLLLSGNHALAEGGADSPAECINADHPGIADSTFAAPSGEIVTKVCIKGGDDTFAGGLKHSGLISADGTYGNNDCFVVSGIGTPQVSVTVNCKSVSHLDVNTGPAPTPPTTTTTPESTPEVTPQVLGETAGPQALPATGSAPAEGAGSDLSLLLVLGGLALLGGTGAFAVAAARRRR